MVKYFEGTVFTNKIGNITLIERLKGAKGEPLFGVFRCHCGKIFTTRISHVSCRKTKSCGCLHTFYNVGDSILTKGGKVTLLERIKTESGKNNRGRFLCYCGKEFEAFIGSVVQGDTNSCGCLKAAQMRELGKNFLNKERWRKDIKTNREEYKEGHIFKTKAGEITLIERVKLKTGKKGIFKCVCGKEFESYINSVAQGDTHSCGCYKRSLIKGIGKSNTGRKKVIF